MRFLLPIVLAALPVFERICDLACAAPVTAEAPAMPRCHPAPAADESSGGPRENDHPCDHSHDVDALLTIASWSRAGARVSLAPAVVPAPNPAPVFVIVARADRIQPSESPPLLRSSRSVLRL